jgi:hypothetical protein
MTGQRTPAVSPEGASSPAGHQEPDDDSKRDQQAHASDRQQQEEERKAHGLTLDHQYRRQRPRHHDSYTRRHGTRPRKPRRAAGPYPIRLTTSGETPIMASPPCNQCLRLRAQVSDLTRQVAFLRQRLALVIGGLRATTAFIDTEQSNPTIARRLLVPAIDARITHVLDIAECRR